MAGMDQSIVIQNRRSRRSNVLLVATLEAGGQSLQVKLRNLSADGALVEAKTLPPEGSEVVFKRKELVVSGRIAWLGKDHAGVAFHDKLEPEQVMRHVPVPRQRPKLDFRRPGLACRELTREERRLVDSWVWSAVAKQPGE